MEKDIKQQLAGFLAEPHLVCQPDIALLKELLEEYPYYQPLHLLMAKISKQQAEGNHALAKAALYTNGKLLHDFLFSTTAKTADFNIIGQATEIIKETPLADEQETFEEIAEVDLSMYRPFRNTDGQTPAPEIEGQETIYRQPSLDDDFMFESIASTDFFAFEQNFDTEGAIESPGNNNLEHSSTAADSNTAATEEHKDALDMQPATNQSGIPPLPDNSQVSNYNDEKLPYTFLWWLAKTRKEHQSIFQPYAVEKKSGVHELQQQYVEHIFHVQDHLTESEPLLDEAIQQKKPVTRDIEIIDNFIRKDPQITPPNAEQIDNENKAKKSAEDQNDLVSETLANIYIEQMLYDKAIDTYQKLSLKFPEKSRYFADLIQSIEKKI